MFVEDAAGVIVAAAKINSFQEECYRQGRWAYEAADHEVMVLHTLVVSPAVKGGGYGTAFVGFY